AVPRGGSARIQTSGPIVATVGSMPLAIRTAKPYDADAIARLLTQLGYASGGTEVGRRLAYWSGDPLSRVLVAERDGAVVGCVAVHAIPYLERTGRWARITSLVVDEAARCEGVGRARVTPPEPAAEGGDCLAVAR